MKIEKTGKFEYFCMIFWGGAFFFKAVAFLV